MMYLRKAQVCHTHKLTSISEASSSADSSLELAVAAAAAAIFAISSSTACKQSVLTQRVMNSSLLPSAVGQAKQICFLFWTAPFYPAHLSARLLLNRPTFYRSAVTPPSCSARTRVILP